MMLVDTPGFQNPELTNQSRGASFEELCHNYAQERLQTLFHERTFSQELERYKEVLPAGSIWQRPAPQLEQTRRSPARDWRALPLWRSLRALPLPGAWQL